MRRVFVPAFIAALLLGLLATVTGASAENPASHVRAGVGVADATWNVGSGAGQYASTRDVGGEAQGSSGFDPNVESVGDEPSYGVQSRLSIRALVVEGANGQRVALVKADNYLAQDHLQRRVEQLLDPALGITRHNIVWSATHNHSSPYDLTPSAGVWLFEDAFNLRMFEYEARQAAKAITQAATSLVPVRMGATKLQHNIFKGNIVGPQIGDDGTPAGYPAKFGDMDLTVLRFDDVSTPGSPRPLATWVNWGQHPESLDGYNLITADYLSALQRDVDRATGSTMVFAQGDVGSSEGPYGDRAGREQLPDGVWREWAHMGYAQMERGASYLAADVVKAWHQIGAGDASVLVPMSTDFPVGVSENWVPGPVSHPYPSAGNCRAQPTFDLHPGTTTTPDCARGPAPPVDAPIYETLTQAGIPLPQHHDTPAFKAVEENLRIHLQAVRLGEVLLASCSCEAQVDLILNLKTRTDAARGNIWDGYPWDQFCDPADATASTYVCENPRTANPADRSLTVTKAEFDRMKAEIHNDAKGWDETNNAPFANAEPTDAAQIKGNFTKQELQDVCPACDGYKLPVGLGHTGDYDGYTVSYREYMNRDSYRKALTSYGAHTADYMVTRLVKMAAALRQGPAVQAEPLDAAAQADEARQQNESIALGHASAVAYDAWLASVADDLGPASVVTEPVDIKRFDAATFTWVGGDNAVDNPRVAVEQRQADGSWTPFADQSGEVQTFLALPKGVASVADTRTGRFQWKWTAHFEAFDPFPTQAARQVPNGTYRFVVDGAMQKGGSAQPYHLASRPFAVAPWDGIQVTDIASLPDGRVSVAVAPVAYPRTYAATAASTLVARFIKDDGRPQVCKTCSFRPWASAGKVASVDLTVAQANGSGTRTLAAAFDQAAGRWVSSSAVLVGETAAVAPGGVRDGFGEINGTPSASVAGTGSGAGAGTARPAVGGHGAAGSAAGRGRGAAHGTAPGWTPLRGTPVSVVAGLGALLVLLLTGVLLAGVGVGREAGRG
ncbi:MAG: hypothetical protein QOK43_1578 [Acidimicrobiaceae bacterium]|nr:hypothetical protein [Acidimicrobiaceae bacterium]